MNASKSHVSHVLGPLTMVSIGLLPVLQMLDKLENVQEDLNREKRRHEETEQQLDSTKRLLEAAEKVGDVLPFMRRLASRNCFASSTLI